MGIYEALKLFRDPSREATRVYLYIHNIHTYALT